MVSPHVCGLGSLDLTVHRIVAPSPRGDGGGLQPEVQREGEGWRRKRCRGGEVLGARGMLEVCKRSFIGLHDRL